MRFSCALLFAAMLTLSACGSDGPTVGADCTTQGAADFQATCVGDDLLYCVCLDYDGDVCPQGKGKWVKQDILCTCSEWKANRCPIE